MPTRPFVALAAIAIIASGAPAGDTTPPPGPVASTMKTLDETEPRVAVNATNTPSFGGSLYAIDTPGSYYLTGNIDAPAGFSGVFIGASNVTLDLMGFTIDGTNAGAGESGVQGDGSVSAIVVRNGHVTNWSNMCLNFEETPDVRIERVHASDAGAYGIFCSDDAAIIDCTIRDSATGLLTATRATITGAAVTGCTNGIETGDDASISRCAVAACALDGIDTADRARIDRCSVSGCGDKGIRAGDEAHVIDCQTSGNQDGILVQDNAHIAGCNASANAGVGINAMGTGSTVERCTASTNGTVGIYLSSFQCAARDCTARGNQTGISTGVDCQVIRCSATQNSGSGIKPTGDTLVDGCVASDNQIGIDAGGGCRIVNNACNDNGAGIYVSGGGCNVEANTVSDSTGVGIEINGAGSVILRNRVHASGADDYLIFLNNPFGPVVDFPGASTASFDHPMANIIY